MCREPESVREKRPHENKRERGYFGQTKSKIVSYEVETSIHRQCKYWSFIWVVHQLSHSKIKYGVILFLVKLHKNTNSQNLGVLCIVLHQIYIYSIIYKVSTYNS